jgi:hypothetical protein
MEIIDAAELTRGRGERTVQVAHSDTGLTRGLDHGEAVLLRVEDGEYHVARVTDIGFEPDDTVYTFELGGRVPGDLARERAEGLSPERHDLELHEIVDLLHDLRDRGPSNYAPAPERLTQRLATL